MAITGGSPAATMAGKGDERAAPCDGIHRSGQQTGGGEQDEVLHEAQAGQHRLGAQSGGTSAESEAIQLE